MPRRAESDTIAIVKNRAISGTSVQLAHACSFEVNAVAPISNLPLRNASREVAGMKFQEHLDAAQEIEVVTDFAGRLVGEKSIEELERAEMGFRRICLPLRVSASRGA